MTRLNLAIHTLILSLVLAGSTSSQAPSYTHIGNGGPGALGVPVLEADTGSLPKLGSMFRARLSNVPDGFSIGITGASRTTWGALALPLDLTGPLVMPGCTLYTSVVRTSTLMSVGGQATWDLALPGESRFLGISFFQQVFVLDPSVLGLGAVMSDANEGVISVPSFALIAYVANAGSNDVTTFRIDPSTRATHFECVPDSKTTRLSS